MRLLRSNLNVVEDVQVPAPTVGERFAGLLDASSADRAVGAFDEQTFHRVLDQLAPDEASLLAVFFDGRPRAAVQVLSRTRFGMADLAVTSELANAAGVRRPQLLSSYLAHLMGLGLLELGGQTEGRDYRLIETDFALGAAKRTSRGLSGNTTIRRCSLELTALGRAFLDQVAQS